MTENKNIHPNVPTMSLESDTMYIDGIFDIQFIQRNMCALLCFIVAWAPIQYKDDILPV